MHKWSIKEHNLPLKYTWKITQGQADFKTNYVVRVESEYMFALGEVAGVTQAEIDKLYDIQAIFAALQTNLDRASFPLGTLQIPTSLRFALSSAWTALLALQQKVTVSSFLGLADVPNAPTCYAIPILPTKEIGPFIERHNLQRFPVLKIKVGGSEAAASCHEVARHFKGPLWIDANQAFADHNSALEFLNAIKNLPIELVEQPLPRQAFSEYRKLKNQSPFPIFADESLQDQDIPKEWSQFFDGVNIKMMKSGSYQQALLQIEQARDIGMKVMLGCMVETSLGISAALNLASLADCFDLDGFLYLEKDPFDLLTEQNGNIYRKPNRGSSKRGAPFS